MIIFMQVSKAGLNIYGVTSQGGGYSESGCEEA